MRLTNYNKMIFIFYTKIKKIEMEVKIEKEANIDERLIRTSRDEFKTEVRVIDIVEQLKPGDIVKGLNLYKEYYYLLDLTKKKYTCTFYGNPLTMCIFTLK